MLTTASSVVAILAIDDRGDAGYRHGARTVGTANGHGPAGAAIDLDNPDASLLLRAVSFADEDLAMPPESKLADVSSPRSSGNTPFSLS